MLSFLSLNMALFKCSVTKHENHPMQSRKFGQSVSTNFPVDLLWTKYFDDQSVTEEISQY